MLCKETVSILSRHQGTLESMYEYAYMHITEWKMPILIPSPTALSNFISHPATIVCLAYFIQNLNALRVRNVYVTTGHTHHTLKYSPSCHKHLDPGPEKCMPDMPRLTIPHLFGRVQDRRLNVELGASTNNIYNQVCVGDAYREEAGKHITVVLGEDARYSFRSRHYAICWQQDKTVIT